MNPTSKYSDHSAPALVNDWLCEQADQLEKLIAPFRATRGRGHQALLLLLNDPQTAPALFEQIGTLSNFLTQLHPLYLDYCAAAERQQQEYEAASPAKQLQLQEQYDPQATTPLLDAVRLLSNEANADLSAILGAIIRWAPESFEFEQHAKFDPIQSAA